jgi:2-methylaconitate cis-trans-isomerase PrpF
MASETNPLYCVIMRGGTSKAVFFHDNELPKDQALRDKIILNVYGSPDPRQIDGLGGADTLTSKLAIISVSKRPDADIDYTFGQVDLLKPFIDYSSNCGNISSAVGPYAISEGLVNAREPITTVRIHNTNTGKIFEADVPVRDGQVVSLGDYAIDGVPGTGARININFAGTVGSKTGLLLPTGKPKENLDVPGFGTFEVSLVDVGSPMVFVNAHDLGLTGIETPAAIDSDPNLLEKLEAIRREAAVRMKIATSVKQAAEKIRAVPMVAFVGPPRDYPSFTTGETVKASGLNFVARVMFMGVTHKAYSVTATVCTASAAVTKGTIVNELLAPGQDHRVIRFGHPCGQIDVQMEVSDGKITRAAVGRTARRIMEGYVQVPRYLFS